MSDRGDWLALTSEEALEPDLPICDPHHHLWDYKGSRYLVEEFQEDISGGHNIDSTVFVECLQFYREEGPEHLRPVGETEFVDRLADQAGGGIAQGIVGFADLSRGAAAGEVLAAHMEASQRFRGIRHASAWHPGDRIHNAHTNPPPRLLRNQRFREGFAVLAGMGLTFDAWLYHPQLPDLIDLANRFPDATIILDHMAGPPGIGPFAEDHQAVFSQWGKQISALSRCENVFIKLGGRAMTLAGFGWHKLEKPPGSEQLAETMQPYFDHCIEAFGPARCMFESNFPVDKASCSYTVLWNAFKRVSSSFSTDERSALFLETAVRAYRLTP